MHFVAASWYDIPAESLAKCFRLAGITSDGRAEPPTHADESSLYGEALPLHIHMDVGEPPNDWHKISDRINYEDFICHNDNLDVCEQPPHMKYEAFSDDGDSSGDEDLKDEVGDDGAATHDAPKESTDSKRVPTFIEALRAYETAARYITSKDVPQKDIAVVADFARVLYDAHAAEGQRSNTTNLLVPKQEN